MSNPLRTEEGVLLSGDAVAKRIVPPFSFERINSLTDGVNYRIADGNDNRFATCYEEEHAQFIVKALNREVQVQ